MTGDSEFRQAVVLGTGQMGPGIALTLARGGLDTVLLSRTPEGAARGFNVVQELIRFWTDERIIAPDEADAVLQRISTSSDHDAAIRPADLVVESIVEDLAVKQQLFTELEMLAGPAAVLCSNTSGLRISDIARRMHRPQRAFTTHFWNPPHLVPLVEIVLGEQSDAVLAQKVRELLQRCEKRPVIVRKDVPGQLGNRLQHALIREALFMLEDGIASAEDIEEALKAGPGLRWPVYGPFEHSDLVGLDLTRAVQASVLPALARNTDPAQLLGRLLEQGKSGARSGEGIYSWRPGDVARVVARRDAFLVEQLRRSRTGDEERT